MVKSDHHQSLFSTGRNSRASSSLSGKESSEIVLFCSTKGRGSVVLSHLIFELVSMLTNDASTVPSVASSAISADFVEVYTDQRVPLFLLLRPRLFLLTLATLQWYLLLQRSRFSRQLSFHSF